jgi:hypothetical protein
MEGAVSLRPARAMSAIITKPPMSEQVSLGFALLGPEFSLQWERSSAANDVAPVSCLFEIIGFGLPIAPVAPARNIFRLIKASLKKQTWHAARLMQISCVLVTDIYGDAEMSFSLSGLRTM